MVARRLPVPDLLRGPSRLTSAEGDPVLLGAPVLVESLVRLRRRLDDVGDAWRSLLLGAPPATA